MLKRTVDFTIALMGLVLLSPVFLLIMVLVKLTSRGPVFFRQERMGVAFRPFFILKFRSMVPDAEKRGGSITSSGDPRVTPVGRWLRKTKIDELPQLLNVLRGEMSLVGPRPEVRKYAEMFREDYEEILRIRPGVTDPASLKYRDESEVLGQFENTEEAYVRLVLPDKIRLAKEYVHKSSLLVDVSLILRTLKRLFA